MRAWLALLIGLSVLVAGAAAAIACLEVATALGAFGSALGSESRHSLPPPNTLFIVEPGSKSDACSYGTTACASASAAHTECPTGSVEVSIGDFFFEPQFSYLPAEGTVCWRNDGQVAHTVTSDEGIWLFGTDRTGHGLHHHLAPPQSEPPQSDLPLPLRLPSGDEGSDPRREPASAATAADKRDGGPGERTPQRRELPRNPGVLPQGSRQAVVVALRRGLLQGRRHLRGRPHQRGLEQAGRQGREQLPRDTGPLPQRPSLSSCRRITATVSPKVYR